MVSRSASVVSELWSSRSRGSKIGSSALSLTAIVVCGVVFCTQIMGIDCFHQPSPLDQTRPATVVVNHVTKLRQTQLGRNAEIVVCCEGNLGDCAAQLYGNLGTLYADRVENLRMDLAWQRLKTATGRANATGFVRPQWRPGFMTDPALKDSGARIAYEKLETKSFVFSPEFFTTLPESTAADMRGIAHQQMIALKKIDHRHDSGLITHEITGKKNEDGKKQESLADDFAMMMITFGAVLSKFHEQIVQAFHPRFDPNTQEFVSM